jgi:hypothetical protein
LIFCVHCGKKNDSGAKFCPFCGKPSLNQAPKEPVVPIDQWAESPGVSRPVANSVDPATTHKESASRPGTNWKLIIIGASGLAGALFIGAGAFAFLPGLLDGGPKELEAFETGARANCISLPADFEVALSEFDVDDVGNPLINLQVGNDLMQWKSSNVAGDVFLFEIDSIYGPSALRAQKLGCDLRFQAQP